MESAGVQFMAVMMDAAEDAKPTNDEQTVDKLFSCAAKHNF
jgi:hypothetical protein